MDLNFNQEKFYGVEQDMDNSFGTHFETHHFHDSFREAENFHWWFTRVFFTIFGLIFFAIVCYVIFLLCFVCYKMCKSDTSGGYVYRDTNYAECDDGAPVVVTQTTHTTHHQQVPGFPVNTYPPMPPQPAPGYPMPQPQQGYPPYPPPQQQPPYPQYGPNMTGYPPALPVDANPPSYDQVVHKQLPYNPNFAGQ